MQNTDRPDPAAIRFAIPSGKYRFIATGIFCLCMTFAILSLQLAWAVILPLLSLLLLIALWQCSRFHVPSGLALCHVGAGWSIIDQKESRVTVELLPNAFIASLVMVLVFREGNGRAQYPVCLLRSRGNDAEFRRLSRLVRLAAPQHKSGLA